MKIWEKHALIYNIIQWSLTGGFWRPVIKALPADISNKRVLELGCGTGQWAQKLKPESYCGTDINSEYIEFAKKNNPKYYKFEVSNVVEDRFPRGKYDYVLIVNVMHHLSDEQVEKLLQKLKHSKSYKKILIVESKAENHVRAIFELMDAGEYFRSFDTLIKMIKKAGFSYKKKIVKAPFRTYKYLVLTASYS